MGWIIEKLDSFLAYPYHSPKGTHYHKLNGMAHKVRVRIGDEIIVDIFEAERKHWASMFPNLIEITHNGEFVVCPKTGEWLRESSPQFVPNQDNVPEDSVLLQILEFSRSRK